MSRCVFTNPLVYKPVGPQTGVAHPRRRGFDPYIKNDPKTMENHGFWDTLGYIAKNHAKPWENHGKPWETMGFEHHLAMIRGGISRNSRPGGNIINHPHQGLGLQFGTQQDRYWSHNPGLHGSVLHDSLSHLCPAACLPINPLVYKPVGPQTGVAHPRRRIRI